MIKEQLALSQLLTLIINFLLGSSIVVGVGMEAKKDAWIVIFAGLFIGILLVMFYFFMLSFLPGKNLFEILEYCVTRPVAIVFTCLYIVYFNYVACRVIRDFGELIATAILPTTPIEFSIVLLVMLIGYILYLGIEVLGRTSEIFTPYTFIFILLLFIFLFANENIKIENILPVGVGNWRNILKGIIPTITVFPYGELIAFSVILPYVTNRKYSRSISICSVIIASFILMSTVFLIIVTLGEHTSARSNFPLLSAARLVSIGEFIERIDALIVFIMMLGILIKSSVFMFGGLKGLEYIFKIPFRYFSIPVSCLVSLFSVFIASDFADHIEEGLHVDKFLLHIPMEFGIPLFICGILLFKKWKSEKNVGKGAKA